jgi:MoaA/NifB/PqqE/SkfB family radical SAM enzyme
MTAAEDTPDVAVTNDLSFLWLEITAKCNLLCRHCYADSGPRGDLHGNMSYGDWTRVIDEAAELGCRSVQFIGGEPTMHPRLADLVDHANHRSFKFIEVQTNATRLGKKLVGCFKRSGVHVGTAFYSDDPAVHEHVTQGKGSWQRTVAGIETALAAGLPVRVGVVETDRNPGHAPRAVAFLKTLGVKNIRTERMRGVGRGELVHLGMRERVPEECAPKERYEELCGQCWKGKLCVTSSGSVFPCPLSRATDLGDVKSGLSAILQTAKLTAFRHKVRVMQEERLDKLRADGAAKRRRAPGTAVVANYDCLPNDCIPTDCIPISCIPTDCIPTNCIPTNCIPTG